jgi:hypothetical protein
VKTVRRIALIFSVWIGVSFPLMVTGQDDWQILFDGKAINAFRGFKKDPLPPNWSIRDGTLKASGGNLDIVTVEQYQDFELELEYRLETGGNSGIFFFVKEHEIFDKVWRTGIEFQVIDNAGSEFAQRSAKNQAGSVFALYAPYQDHTLPAGNWNRVRIRAFSGQVEYWMNDHKILDFQVGSDAWYADREETLHNSERKPFWGEFRRGHIALQDEGFPVAYRNIRIRSLER